MHLHVVGRGNCYYPSAHCSGSVGGIALLCSHSEAGGWVPGLVLEGWDAHLSVQGNGVWVGGVSTQRGGL